MRLPELVKVHIPPINEIEKWLRIKALSVAGPAIFGLCEDHNSRRFPGPRTSIENPIYRLVGRSAKAMSNKLGNYLRWHIFRMAVRFSIHWLGEIALEGF